MSMRPEPGPGARPLASRPVQVEPTVFQSVYDSLSATVPTWTFSVSVGYVAQDHPYLSRAGTSSQLPTAPSQRSPAAKCDPSVRRTEPDSVIEYLTG